MRIEIPLQAVHYNRLTAFVTDQDHDCCRSVTIGAAPPIPDEKEWSFDFPIAALRPLIAALTAIEATQEARHD